ncbi:MAG: dynamin family protein [Sandaracinaceae bacterium]
MDGRPEALLALVDLDLEEGDLAAAEEWARRALVRHGGRPAMSRLAEVLHRAGRSEEAVEVLLAAADAADPSLLRRAARVVPLDAPLALAKVVAALELLAPEDPLGRALRAWLALDSDEPDVARERLGPEESVEPRWVLARARLAYRSGLSQLALELLARPGFAEHDRVRVERLRRDALRSRWRGAGGELDLAAAIDEVARFGDERGLEALARGARELRDELDRPLLLAILGEFNAGKSTLVNAFVGADVAPTGIVPTTATLNLLRGGAERRVRVVRRDGTTREGAYADLRALLEEADAETTPERAVDHIEIVLPSELLERVWVLDTPGSNAPVRDHERLAREALRRADAVLWVFDAGQAGKATEGKVLETIRASRRHVVAALNKVDRLAEGELPRVVASLTAELPDLHGRVVALSAKRALTARLREDEEALGASGFTALRELLESDVFGRSRHLKGRAVGGRLLEVLDRALAAEAEAVGAQGQREQRLTEAREALARAAAAMATTLDAALDELEGRQRAAFRSAAEEVLAFVRPRAHRFARHGADREDRAFLGELIEERLGRGVAVLEASLLGGIADLLEPARAALGVDSASVTRRVAAHVAPPIARFRGYQSGHLDGGALRQFFDRVLPRAELALEPLAEALDAARIPSAQELRPELEQALAALRADIAAELEARIEASREELGQVQEGTYEPLRALRTVVEELVAAPSTAAGAASSTAAGGGASTRPS